MTEERKFLQFLASLQEDLIVSRLGGKSEAELLALIGITKEDANAFFAKVDEAAESAVVAELEKKSPDEVRALVADEEGSDEFFAKVDQAIANAPTVEKPSNVRDITTARRWKPRTIGLLYGGAGIAATFLLQFALATAGVIYAGIGAKPSTTPISTAAAGLDAGKPPASEDPAEHLRNHAYSLCFEHEFQGCLDELNAAQVLDPTSDGLPAVRGARAYAMERLTRRLTP